MKCIVSGCNRSGPFLERFFGVPIGYTRSGLRVEQSRSGSCLESYFWQICLLQIGKRQAYSRSVNPISTDRDLLLEKNLNKGWYSLAPYTV